MLRDVDLWHPPLAHTRWMCYSDGMSTTTLTLVRVRDPKTENAGNRLHHAYLTLHQKLAELHRDIGDALATDGVAALDALNALTDRAARISHHCTEVRALLARHDNLTAEQVNRACTAGPVKFIHALPTPSDPAALNLPDDVAAAAVTRGVPVTAADPLLTYNEAAKFLTDTVGRQTAAATLRSYRRNGLFVVPDLQVGGEVAAEDYRFPSYPGQTRDPMPADPTRPWTERERVEARSYWLQSTIVGWNEGRLGSGRVAGGGTGTSGTGESAPRRRRRRHREDLTATPA